MEVDYDKETDQVKVIDKNDKGENKKPKEEEQK
jgi:hypothetical protein